MKMNSRNSIVISILSILVFLCTGCDKPAIKIDNSDKQEFEALYNSYQALLSYKGASYRDFSKKSADLQDQARIYLKNFPKSDNRAEVERILSETKEMELKLQQEQFDFSELVREYIVIMRGAIMGINRYRLTIQVSGVILGTNQTGVSYNIAGATKVSDYRI
ncbi:MAG: hypothetical protein PVH61_27550 [Candidatus Aminicenantes bacterium]|jgi:hypothetical protein